MDQKATLLLTALFLPGCLYISSDDHDARLAAACEDCVDEPAGDCDGHGDGGGFFTCDSAAVAELSGDCDDGDAAVHPEAVESCDGVDNDCDGGVDGGATGSVTWYPEGGGLFAQNAFVTAQGCDFVQNHTDTPGSAILLLGASADIQDSEISVNTLDQVYGGAIDVGTGASAVGQDVRFADNEPYDISVGAMSVTMNGVTSFNCSDSTCF